MALRVCAKQGTWYPACPELDRMVSGFLAAGAEKVDKEPGLRFVVSPHAGLVYSGPTAGHAFAAVNPALYDTVIMLGVCHGFFLRGLGCSPFSLWANPLEGQRHLQFETLDGIDAVPAASCQREHSLEILMPFLAKVFGQKIAKDEVRFVAVYAGRDPSSAQLDVLCNALRARRTLLVVSSDFVHFGDSFDYLPMVNGLSAAEVVTRIDMECFHAMEFGSKAFKQAIEKTQATVCGRHTIYTALRAMEELDVRLDIRLAHYSKSNEPETYRDHSVSYCGIFAVEKRQRE